MRRRGTPDGLPFRLYERYGKRTYSIGYKSAQGTWSFRFHCSRLDAAAVQKIRSDAVKRCAQMLDPSANDDSFNEMVAAFFKRQEALPLSSVNRRAESTLAENRREATNLQRSFGQMNIHEFKPSHAYDYLDACEEAGRGPKGNKEISLAAVMFENYIRNGRLSVNPFKGIRKIQTSPSDRVVTQGELDIALSTGRAAGGVRHLAALALWTAYLCVRRSGEVLNLQRFQLQEDGIHWTATKPQRGQSPRRGVITWSPVLRQIIDETSQIKRNNGAGDDYVFGNLAGHRYTKGGWKKTLSNLMEDCMKAAAKTGTAFTPFSLQDCRPTGVTEKLDNGDSDVRDATLHSSDRVLNRHYDRRKRRVATPTK